MAITTPPTEPADLPGPSSAAPAPAPGPAANVPQEDEADPDPISRAEECKAEGTACFLASQWTEALVAYRAGLACLPKREPPAPVPPPDDISDDEGTSGSKGKAPETKQKESEVVDVASPAVSAADMAMQRLRAVLQANIAACLVKLGEDKDAVKACTEAILDDPKYVKARERRAACNERIGSWTSLSSAQDDYTALLELQPAPAQQADLKRKLAKLKPRLEAQQKKETDEMLGKLKGLGNSILGNFGLSTDNFKFEPNGSGGYSLNFQR